MADICPTLKLLTTLNQIDPKNLELMSHDDYIIEIAKIISTSLEQDFSQLLLVIQTIKDCGKPCYKRDVLIETLHEILIAQDRIVLLKVLCDISQTNCDLVPWKEVANSLVTLPDLVANCGLLKRFSGFAPKYFYHGLLETVYCALSKTVEDNKSSNPREEVALFYAHLIGRIAIAGYGTLVWNKFTSRLVAERDTTLRNLGSTVLCIPLRVAKFEIFIGPLYGPIFYHMRANPANGRLIESIIGSSLLHNETLKHIVCKKYILQTNFNQDRHHQNLILYNIFSYLSCLVNNNESTTTTIAAATSSTKAIVSSSVDDKLDTKEQQGSSILIETVLELAKSWSNSTKILLRPYEHNRYISCALVMALKFALESKHQQCLIDRAFEIQSEVIHGLQVYLSRSSNELRNVAMCVAQIVLPKLHELIDAERGKDLKKKVPLEFDAEWDESCLAIKRMFEQDTHTFCKELDSQINSHDNDDGGDVRAEDVANSRQQDEGRRHNSAAVARNVSETDKHGDDDDDDALDDFDGDSMDAPIYLNDCIDGLVDNKNPRYVKICLLKVVEITRQLSKQPDDEPQARAGDNQKVKNRDTLKKATTNDAIRDVAIELSQVLLYLEDQYSLHSFDQLQRNALVSLNVAAPDLVAKFLLDELNNQTKNIRQQTLILQTLIESAQQLGNRFIKYGALYFYGMVHQLKISTLAPSPSLASSSAIRSIVSAVKSMKADQLVASDDSYLLSRVLLSVSLIIKCLNQQPITCKLSNDLLDILAAYRHHPDSGVRKAIVSCLTVIRDCTPAVYFREYLNDKAAHLFGAWLVIESEFIRKDK